MVLRDYLPPALRGLMVAAFLAAFMSTIGTQLNWGSSYLVNDLYKRFVVRDATEKHYVLISKIFTVFLVLGSGYTATRLASINQGWQLVLNIGFGTGAVYILRWYWSRINAWSEIVAMAVAALMTIGLSRVSFTGSDSLGLREDRADHGIGHDHCMGDRDLRHPPGVGRDSHWVLQARSPDRVRLATHRRTRARDAAGTRCRRECVQLGDGCHSRVRLPVRNRKDRLRPIGMGTAAARPVGHCGVSHLLGSFTARVEHVLREGGAGRGLDCPGGRLEINYRGRPRYIYESRVFSAA